jgi:hypothetical protein
MKPSCTSVKVHFMKGGNMLDREVEGANPFVLAFEHRGDFLHVLLTGKLRTLDHARESLYRITFRCMQEGHDQVVLEKDLTEDISVEEMNTLVGDFVSLQLTNIKFAIVDRNKKRWEANVRVEAAAVNAGARLGLFSNLEEAEDWLRCWRAA